MEKLLVMPIAKFDNTRKLYYKLVWLDDEKQTLLLTIWGQTIADCNELTSGVFEKMKG